MKLIGSKLDKRPNIIFLMGLVVAALMIAFDIYQDSQDGVNKFDEFVPKMAAVFKKNKVNVINVSIRHALPDSGTYLAWAPTEVFSFVVYYKQATTSFAKNKVADWTQQMIDQVLLVGGRYYLPYQIHATEKQFKAAYPGHEKFFAVKKKVDPTNKFRNKLWDKYYK